MRKLISANFARLWRSPPIRFFLIGMLLLSSGLMFIQYTAMDYSVPLSRVIFLSLSLYGVVAAAFVSMFVGTDFSDGFIRNKLICARSRHAVVCSHIITSCFGCILIYLIVTLFTLAVGAALFENDVLPSDFFRFLALGIGMSAAYGVIFSVITLLSDNKARAIIICMVLSMLMLFLCLHTNQLLVQTEYKDGVLNPHYVGGFRRTVYGVLHDLNPCGQAAQLSSWEVWNPARVYVINLFWMIGTSALGCALFKRKDIN